MNRAPITNGHSTEAASARSGYDAYFAQIDESSDSDVTGGAATHGYSQHTDAGAAAAAQSAASPQSLLDNTPHDGGVAPSGAVSTPDPARSSAVSGPAPAGGTAAENGGSAAASSGAISGQPTSHDGAVPPQQPPGAAPEAVGPAQQVQPTGSVGESLSLQEQPINQAASNAAQGVASVEQPAAPASQASPQIDDRGTDASHGVSQSNRAADTGYSVPQVDSDHPAGSAGRGAAHAEQAVPDSAAVNAARAAQTSGAAAAANEPQATPNATSYVQGTGPAANESASPWVPDRIQHAAYDPTPRVEVLPPNLSLSSAELLADIAAVRQAQLRSAHGVRGALNKVGFNLGLSPAEQRTEDRRSRIRRQLTDTYQIAVISVKGGVGRTTTTATLGSTFANLRPDRVVAIDANPDFGDLTTRTARHPYGLSMRDLTRATQRLEAFSAVHAYTSTNAADLAVVASPWNTDATEALSGPEYTAGTEVLRRHYNLLVVDCGTGVLDSVTNTVLRTSDAVVVVTPATVGGVTGAVATLNWLSSHGFDRLIANSRVAIVHQQPNKPMVEVSAIEKLFATAQRPTCEIPYDEHLAEGGEIDLRLLEKETALSFEEIAAALADGFPGQGPGAAPSMGDRGGWR